jgi:hypothetical protein
MLTLLAICIELLSNNIHIEKVIRKNQHVIGTSPLHVLFLVGDQSFDVLKRQVNVNDLLPTLKIKMTRFF